MEFKINQILFFFLSLTVFSTGFAAIELKSGCFLDEHSKEVFFLGKTTDDRHPIASVSKVFTTLLAASKFQLAKSPFSTQFFVRSITTSRGKPGFHVHIKGSGDPYFNRYKMHRAISMLNQLKVSEIDLLTFDENVNFLSETDTKDGFYVIVGYNSRGEPIRELITPLTLKAEVDFPPVNIVKAQFQESWKLKNDYKNSLKIAKGLGISMVSVPQFNARKVEFLPAAEFKADETTKTFFVESQATATMLKMMNWNSNNYTANRFYLAAGADASFRDVFYKNYQVPESQLTFINGSGQNHDLKGDGPRLYNESTCSIVLRTLRNLNKRVMSQGKKLTDIMPVIGIDIGSTVGGLTYSNDFTKGKIVAKTGTVATNVSLAGAINTKSGYRYFMFNVGDKKAGVTIPEHVSRKLISDQLTALVKNTPDVVPFDYKPNLALMDQYGFENYEEDGVSEQEVPAAPSVIVTFSSKKQITASAGSSTRNAPAIKIESQRRAQ